MKRGLSKSQVICIILLWVALCIMLVVYSPKVTGETIFTMIVSGVIIFVAIAKGNNASNRRRRNRD
jgi:hypothetical protein